MVCTGKQDFLQWRNTWLALPLLIQWHLVRLSMMTMLLTLNGLLLLVPILMQLRNVATFLAVWLKALQLWMLLQQRMRHWQAQLMQMSSWLGRFSCNSSTWMHRGADGGSTRSCCTSGWLWSSPVGFGCAHRSRSTGRSC